MVSVIVPVLNEERCLKEGREYYRRLSAFCELIFSDGGSTDETVSVAQTLGTVVSSRRGRAYQKNAGADRARGQSLVFLHVDTQIDPEFLIEVGRLFEKNCRAGIWKAKILDERPFFRYIEKRLNHQACIRQVTDGDLGLYVHRDVFQAVGGFDPTGAMEDILIGEKIGRVTPIAVFDEPISISARKWDEHGFLKVFLMYGWNTVRLPFLRRRVHASKN